MSDNPKLLVVDDEEVICLACRRIFSRQGFQVEVNTDACEGLNCAEGRLRGHLVGYQDAENRRHPVSRAPAGNQAGPARADHDRIPEHPQRVGRNPPGGLGLRHETVHAGRDHAVGAADYGAQRSKEAQAPMAVADEVDAQDPRAEEILFYDESWFRLELDDSACVGAVLPGLRGETVKAVRLPRIGEVVYQGLPLAALTVAGKPAVVVRSPVSGVVAGVNDALADEPALVTSDPCGQGWIACLCTTRFEEEVKACKPRHVLLVNAERCSADAQRQRLASLGCRVSVAGSSDDVTSSLRDADCSVLLVDAASCGAAGPELVARVNAQSSATKIVVIASARDQLEIAYRGHRIFYYAVEPFADNEIADILDAAFRPPEPHPAKALQARGGTETIGSIAITNRNGHKVCLLASPGLLRRGEGLGCRIGQELLAGAFPLVMMPGEANITAAAVLKAAATCDRVMVLLAKDSGLLPGQPVARHEGRVRHGPGRERGPRDDPGRAAGPHGRIGRVGRADDRRAGRPHRARDGIVREAPPPSGRGPGRGELGKEKKHRNATPVPIRPHPKESRQNNLIMFSISGTRRPCRMQPPFKGLNLGMLRWLR